MVNIQIYLHAKFHIFEALKYFSYFYSLMLIYSIGKRI
jgi:hypothetical protein